MSPGDKGKEGNRYYNRIFGPNTIIVSFSLAIKESLKREKETMIVALTIIITVPLTADMSPTPNPSSYPRFSFM